MGGLILLSILAAWFFVVQKLAQFCVRKMQEGHKKRVVYIVVLSLLCVAPVADEVIGGFQFLYLCQTKAHSVFKKEIAYGKTVYLESAEVTEPSETILPTSMQNWVYADSNSKKIIVSYIALHSDGGWLSRWVNFNNNPNPYIFSGYCSGDEGGYLFRILNIQKLDRKDINVGYEK